MPNTPRSPGRDLQSPPLPDAAWTRRLHRRLRDWFGRHARDLPWRRTSDPYAVWVSEIMLQQTQVATVIPYFERFLQRFPDVGSLAAADEEEVLRFWEGLGYYRRARQLHAAARTIAAEHDGRFPDDPLQVLALPGIGRYTAGAILSIARDARLPILEANTMRLFCRLLAYEDDPTRSAGQRLLWAFAEHILPRTGCGQFNQALMELGSTVCTPRQPACLVCPLSELCVARQRGLEERLPVAGKKTQYEERHEAAVIVRKNGRVLVRRCGSDERWAGLWDFPRFVVADVHGGALEAELRENVLRLTGLIVEPGRRLTTLRHGVTRYRITLACHEATLLQGRLRKDTEFRWLPPRNLGGLPLSVTGRQLSRLLLEEMS